VDPGNIRCFSPLIFVVSTLRRVQVMLGKVISNCKTVRADEITSSIMNCAPQATETTWLLPAADESNAMGEVQQMRGDYIYIRVESLLFHRLPQCKLAAEIPIAQTS
jgi:hypothetical protein